MVRRLTIAVMVAGMLVALVVPVARATTPLTIPSGTEVIPHVAYDSSSNASLLKLYDPVTGKDETISSTEGTDSYLWQPQLSEDGKKVLFLDYHDYGPGDERQESVGFVPSNGGKRTRIVTGEGISEYDLSWDGSKILYQTYTNGEAQLFTAPVERNASPTEVPLPSNFYQVFDPIFDKDGTGIFFTAWNSNNTIGGPQLYHINLDGTGATKLTDFTPTSKPNGQYPLGKELSPDGNTIVYSGHFMHNNMKSGIYALPVSGGTPQEVAVPSSGEHHLNGPHYNHDGSKIMYTATSANSSDPDGPTQYALYSVSAADGSNKQLLAEGFSQPGNWEIVTYASRAPTARPQSKADCKHGGHKEFSFKNQGKCVAFVKKATEDSDDD
jgi:hypothetical protein